MRRVSLGFTLIAATAAVGCPGKPPGEEPGVSEPPKALVRPVAITAEDWKAALPRTYPEALRQGMSDEALAKELELQAWAFEFEGGPLRCWLEFEEASQKTMPPREPAKSEWECNAKGGRIVFSVGRGMSERMRKIMRKLDQDRGEKGQADEVAKLIREHREKLGKDPYPESVVFVLRFRSTGEGRSGSYGTSHEGSPLWFGWPGGEKKFLARADRIDTARDGEPVNLLRVECIEPSPANKDNPRSAVLILKGSFRGKH